MSNQYPLQPQQFQISCGPPAAPGPPPFPPNSANPYGMQSQPIPYHNQSNFNHQRNAYPSQQPSKLCYICRDPSHLANACPHRKPRPLQDFSSRNPSDPPPTQVVSPTNVNLDMDSVEEANLVRLAADKIRKRKRPANAEDLKEFAVTICQELTKVISHPPKQPSKQAACNSPGESHSKSASRQHYPRRDRPAPSRPAPSCARSSASRVGSINSTAANTKMRSIFEEQIHAMRISHIKTKLDDAGIDWTANDFRDITKKTSLITQLAIFMAQQSVSDLKAASR